VSVTGARGFAASGVHAGIRRASKDVAVVRSLEPAVGAAVWTTNRVLAAPVLVSKRHLAKAEPQAVVVNSGVANAATGSQGVADAEQTAATAARLLALEKEQVVVLSTGVIGVPLPLEKLLDGLRRGAEALSPTGGADAAEAILTTDRSTKEAVSRGDGFVVGGMAKGAGMIHPRLATMLAVVTSDYPLGPGEAGDLLRAAVAETFNRVSVDGDCSTNDAVILLANGASGIARDSASESAFAEALHDVCANLARQIVEDGEGATVLIEVNVTSASSEEEALAIARRIATSPLVKTAAFGRDPNWGRVLAAAGSAPWNGGFANLDPDRLTVAFDGVAVFEEGSATGLEPAPPGPELKIELDLGLGAGSASYLASDLTYDYVRLNAEYTT
jgi:glutamate N-acetyltransferase/amino-acid N-acetyltransferase